MSSLAAPATLYADGPTASIELKDSPDSARLAEAWLSLEEVRRLIVDEDLRLVWANDAALAELEGDGDLRLREGALIHQNRVDHGRVVQFVRDCGTEPSSLCLRREEGGAHLLLRGRAIGEAEGVRYAGLTFHTSDQAIAPRYADLRQAFYLTHSEHKVLLKMMEGMTADQVAEHFLLSVETVRTHIRKIYVKTGVASREGLFCKLRPYRL